MLTKADFRRLALGMNDVVESAHMGHPDFRVQGRIFATLHGDLKFGMVALTPDQQRELYRTISGGIHAGTWRVGTSKGSTAVRLDAVDEETAGEALTLARHNVAAKAARRGPKAKSREPH